MSFSLNLHTGYTGMVNFGVIFFVAIGTITVGILTAPENLHGYDWASPQNGAIGGDPNPESNVYGGWDPPGAHEHAIFCA